MVEPVELVGDVAKKFWIGKRVEPVVVALSLKPGISSGGRQGVGLHHHAVEIIVAFGQIFHNRQSLVGASVQNFYLCRRSLALRNCLSRGKSIKQ